MFRVASRQARRCSSPMLKLLVRLRAEEVWALAIALLTMSSSQVARGAVGIFEGTSDVGGPKRPGAAVHDDAQHTYTVTGGGKNMWFTNDAFHFVWKKFSGDVALEADVVFRGTGGDPHRKACLLV